MVKDRGIKKIPTHSEATEPAIVVSSKTKAESASSARNHSGFYPGTRQTHKGKVRGIYGKIMANGKPLKGVTVMVPGSRIVKESNSEGKYYIQVPANIDSLKFIYQGKQLVKELDPISRNRDLHLKIEG